MQGLEMWTKTFTKEYKNISKEAIWEAWVDVKNWPKWDTELEHCEINANFEKGAGFILKPKGGPKVRLHLSEVVANTRFTDYCKFFGAVMYDAHELETLPNGQVKVTNTITVKGPFSFIWVNLVAKNVAKAVPEQTDNLIEYARKNHV